MSQHITRKIADIIAASLEIPESAYEKAEARYKDLAAWLGRPEARCANHDPHVYSQGSFRLGTVNWPLGAQMEYDLDMGCRLCEGITKYNRTQRQLKEMVGADLEDYRKARQIQETLEEKRRCWRLRYQDQMSFHLDAVPSIPEDDAVRSAIKASVMAYGVGSNLAEQVSKHAGAVTDNHHSNYDVIAGNWKISNSEGYALWFESRMKLASGLMQERATAAKALQIDELKPYRWKSPLQSSVQILKRHRDVMFARNPEGAPISVIITTLAGHSYQGEADVASALDRIVNDMEKYVRTTEPHVPNPVHPAEDFADKWFDPEYAHMKLTENFKAWVSQVKRDFRTVAEARDPQFLSDALRAKFGIEMSADTLDAKIGFGVAAVLSSPKSHSIEQAPARPWTEEPR